ncbi:MAG: hypothetical protein V4719_00815 [Planctomycetota bacterium]
MADVTIAPSDEACQALVAWINAGDKYTLPAPSAYSYLTIEELGDVTQLQVDVTHVSAIQLSDSLDGEDPSVHTIIVWVRDKLPTKATAEIAVRNLIFQQIYQRVNGYRFPANRVKVRECGYDDVENPDRDLIETQLLFKAGITIKAEVSPP